VSFRLFLGGLLYHSLSPIGIDKCPVGIQFSRRVHKVVFPSGEASSVTK
jgi:hypothetical protein